MTEDKKETSWSTSQFVSLKLGLILSEKWACQSCVGRFDPFFGQKEASSPPTHPLTHTYTHTHNVLQSVCHHHETVRWEETCRVYAMRTYVADRRQPAKSVRGGWAGRKKTNNNNKKK